MGGRGSSSGKSGGAGTGSNKPALSQIEVNTNTYQFSSGKMPSGRGNWAFSIGGETVFFNGSYAQAKKEAKKRAQSQGISRISVLP